MKTFKEWLKLNNEDVLPNTFTSLSLADQIELKKQTDTVLKDPEMKKVVDSLEKNSTNIGKTTLQSDILGTVQKKYNNTNRLSKITPVDVANNVLKNFGIQKIGNQNQNIFPQKN